MIRLHVNGVQHEVDVDPTMPLLWVLRDVLGLTGTKYGCGIGRCGACMVHLDGFPTFSCVTRVASVKTRRVVTIEGLAAHGGRALQAAWIDEQVPQCGYCQPGQLMAAAALLAGNASPSDDDITAAMEGNLCRCGTYQRIRRAIKRAAAARSRHG